MSGGIELQPGSTSASSVPTINNSGLESGSTTPASALNKQSVIGDPQTAQTSGIAPLDKAQTGDLLGGTESKDAEGGMSATQLLSSGVGAYGVQVLVV